MTKHITHPPWGAIAGVAICFLATCKLMFSDVTFWQPSSITNDQAASFAALAVAILAGHYCWPELKALRITGLGLLILAIASSWYVVTTSAGRTSESRADTAAQIRKANEIREAAKARVDGAERDIETAKADLKTAMAAYQVAQAKLSAECGTGKGKLCQGHIEAEAVARQAVREARGALDSANRHYEDMQAKLSQLPAPRVENAGYKHTAAWVASLPYVTTPATVIAELLATQIPGLLALICEFGTIVFSNVVFRRAPVVQGPPPLQLPPPGPVPVSTPATVSGKPKPPKTKRQRPTDVQLMHEAIEALGGVAHSQNELADYWGISKGEVAKRVEACGDYLKVRRVGRCHEVRINDAFDYV